ncbi:glycosyl hydrolase family 95 catalytic domain-containing protein [Lachnotalea glycerini]|uniref:Glycoside hydrolase family 95 protein n=1 Tax=Lachnotalea glycerini TaxID=1763509 RepID=A0A371JD17_9FIRM|nr:glycoside hydrolase family 95 protein [Lachnotalea glycerini]RDY30660.1 glycoside hydrolase family 95 protein [Lachnotalea glycerini]
MKLWYQKPAASWEEALPIGNGRLGAMVCGGIQKELLYLNEDSIWYGKSINRINPDAYNNLDNVRELILNGEIQKAEELLKVAFSGTPQSQRPYQSLGKMTITMQGLKEESQNYVRSLELETGICTTTFTIGEAVYTREVFSSYPNKIMVMHMTCSQKASISFQAFMSRERYYDNAGAVNNHTIYMDGNLGKGGVEFYCALMVKANGGNVRTVGEHLIVEEADSVMLCFAADTTFYSKEPKRNVQKLLNAAAKKSYDKLKLKHITDFSELMQRVSFTLIDGENASLPTDERIKAFGAGIKDNSLAALYFQYGRYLLVSSSRPGSLPANLQGIWNNNMTPCWDSKFTININTEMNYWPVEICNLSECHQPLFEHLKRLVKTGKKTAKKMYGCRGFCAHHNTDLWADSAPQDIYTPASYWTQGGAWLCTHLWMHYQYTINKEWLKKVAYPILREAVLFYTDFLVEKDEYLVTCPSVSPENTYIRVDKKQVEGQQTNNVTSGCACYGPTMDNQILRDVFSQFIEMVRELELDDDLEKQAKLILTKLPPNQVGKYGQIMEWCEDYDEAEPGHRHISHLYGLYPSHQITVDKTPELIEAAKTTLKRRLDNGGGHTGWSCAWIINFYTRLHDGNTALSFLQRIMRQSTYPNLMDNHPLGSGSVFQIDGNFGACAAIAEMLVQSDDDKVWLLPALPDEWEEGEVKGLCVYGGASIDLMWKNHKLKTVELHSRRIYPITLIYRGTERTIQTDCNRLEFNL